MAQKSPSFVTFPAVILWLMYLIPILGVTGFIIYFGVNVPFYDQWVLPALFEKIATGTLQFKDLFELHNNHRILFPRLIFIALGFISSWNIKLELFLSLGLAILTFILLYKISANTSKNQNYFFHFTNLLTALIFFSLAQSENWLWGFQIAIFFINFCVIFSCFILNNNKIKPKTKLLFAAILCLIASFSSAQGLMSWLALIPGIIMISESGYQRRKYLIFWMTLFLSSSLIYSIGYTQEPKIINLSLLEKLFTFIQFFFNVIAAPVTNSQNFSIWIGIIIILNFIVLGSYCLINLKNKKYLIKLCSPWFSIGIFSILCSIVITLGRYDYGANYAIYTSRYTTHSLLLIIAVIQLWFIIISEGNFYLKNYYPKLIYSFIGGILVCLIAVKSEIAIAQAQTDVINKQRGETCLELINYLEDSQFFKTHPERCLLRLSKTTWWIQDGVKQLQGVNLRNWANNITFKTESEQLYGYIDFPLFGDQPLKLKPKDDLTLKGWAIFPQQQNQPQLVFLSRGNQQTFFANANIGLNSPDIAQVLSSPLYNYARWEVTIPTVQLYNDLGNTRVKAWVYNPDGNEFIPLKGEVNIILEKN
ncbi:hypothetical protein NO976_01546 [Planktothrix agardhii]|jgi:hypothetical protein|uniref:hypothetical protein n=1 Tax=Planktothrix agardhii TaxID=1160 RepID=UPI001A24FE96|nr:hypothetical protein [Planktothrix agardhii]MBG0746285.1 hypothetical protein [Planktothrix agardhii KL2]MCB8777183.1 hypothetical protein [Planktothrix agardhii 1031]MCF3576384.1 hypothetical protein [Planktothrix agardhii 1812]MCF3579791.1 hypothetical protein [Planktothrix agardhii 1811]MCF3599312.1 hypothetical protein [Planktothrix agardhii 1032]